MAAEPSRRGFIATLTMRNARGIDPLVANSTTRSASIQARTNQDSAKAWRLDAKAEELVADNPFHVFVNLEGQSAPSFHVVESAIVAESCSRTHRGWLTGEPRDGSVRKDTTMQPFHDPEGLDLNAWDKPNLYV